MEPTIYESAGREEAFLRLAHAWHARCLADPIVSHAFSHGVHPQHTERLAAYWAEALGGPPAYSSSLGDESAVVRMHSGNGEHDEMDARAIACFEASIGDAHLPDDVRAPIAAYFRWSIRRMSAYPASADDVPAGLAFARWSWDGPIT
jgi:hemoglobin